MKFSSIRRRRVAAFGLGPLMVAGSVLVLVPPQAGASAYSPTDNVPCGSVADQAKAKATWYAPGGGRDYLRRLAGSALDSFAEINDGYDGNRSTFGLLHMAMACGDDALVQSIATAWDDALSKRVLWEMPWGGPNLLTWLYSRSGAGTGPCTNLGGVPAGNVCTTSGDAFTTANSVDCELCVTDYIYYHSLIISYIARTSTGSRRAWTAAYLAKWTPVVRDHLERYIMRETWGGLYALPGGSCTNPGAAAGYSSSLVGKEQALAKRTINAWGTVAEWKPGCNSIRDSDGFQIAAAAEYLRANIADPLAAPFSGGGSTMTQVQMKGFVSVANAFYLSKFSTKALTDFGGRAKTGSVFQAGAYVRLLNEADYGLDTDASLPPATCLPGQATPQRLSTTTANLVSGSAIVQVPSTVNLPFHSFVFNADGGTTGVPWNGSAGQPYYFVGEILDATHFRMDMTADRGLTVTSGAANASVSKSINFSVRTPFTSASVGEDTSHMGTAFIYFLWSQRALNGVAKITSTIPDSIMVQTANQFAYGMGNKDLTYPQFSNYQDGSNGWNRPGYGSSSIDGYEPFEGGNTGAVHGFFWLGMYNHDVNILSARWRQIWEATSGPDYAWRVGHLGPGGPRWNGCVRSATATLNMAVTNNFAHQIFYPSLSPLARAVVVKTTKTKQKQPPQGPRFLGWSGAGHDPQLPIL